jgi:hypothetical protein
MKFVSSILLIALLSLVAGLYLRFWALVPAAFLVSLLIPQSPGKSFLSGFLAVFLLWGCLALYMDAANNYILGNRMSQMIFKVPNSLLMVGLTALIGGLVSGMSALTASFIHQPAKQKEQA